MAELEQTPSLFIFVSSGSLRFTPGTNWEPQTRRSHVASTPAPIQILFPVEDRNNGAN